MGGLKTNLNRKIVTETGRNGRARSGSGRWKGESEVVQYILAITRISLSYNVYYPCILLLFNRSFLYPGALVIPSRLLLHSLSKWRLVVVDSGTSVSQIFSYAASRQVT